MSTQRPEAVDAAAGRGGKVAVVAHRRKTVGGGLEELRKLIAEETPAEPLWYEVSKSRKAAKRARAALKDGADLVFVWGGDGTVQRCLDALSGSAATVAIVPAGTANLLASNLGIPNDLPQAVRVGFHGRRRKLDLGKVNGEHFAVMAGVGFDAAMIGDAGRAMKGRLGRLAYVWTGLRHVTDTTRTMRVKVDGKEWFHGRAGCLLLGNVGTITGGLHAFPDARPDDGWLDVGVTTAGSPLQWARTLGRMAVGRAEKSPLVELTRGRKIRVKLARPTAYELDGGARGKAGRLSCQVVPDAVTICVPPD
jgi:diacylglycerol kinase (ATP)